MVSQREGHTSGVHDLFFRTHLSNAELQLVVQSSLFVKDCFQKSSLSLMQVGVTFSWGISLGSPALALFFSLKEKKNRTLQTGNRAARLGGQDIPDRTEAVVVESLPELWFRAPTKNGALSPQSWEGEGGPWIKGRAGTMVNHRVKHAASG